MVGRVIAWWRDLWAQAAARAKPEPERPPELTIVDGWIHGEGVVRVPSHPSWYYARLATPGGAPIGVIDHYTATAFGTAASMARRRTLPLAAGDRQASWHVTVAHDGTIWQQAPFTAGCWHVYGGRIVVGGRAYEVNRACVGIEHEGYGIEWPEPMVLATMRLHRALRIAYAIPRERLCLHHSTFAAEAIRAGRISAASGRSDPGPRWTRDVEPRVLEHAFAA